MEAVEELPYRREHCDTEHRTFEVRFFNDKDVNIALWDPKVEFYVGERLIHSASPKQPISELPYWAPIGPIDLPSRTSVYKTMQVEARGDPLEKLQRSDWVRFVATSVPEGRQISEPLRRWTPYEQTPP